MKSVHVRKSDLATTLKVLPTQGKNLLEPFKSFALKNRLPFSILEDTHVSNDAEVHLGEGDLWFCLEGEATFVCGGSLVDGVHRLNADGTLNKNELYAKEIAGGREFRIRVGDWLWIPAGEPHQHSALGTARLCIIKVPKVGN